jgi:hypothetical protein
MKYDRQGFTLAAVPPTQLRSLVCQAVPYNAQKFWKRAHRGKICSLRAAIRAIRALWFFKPGNLQVPLNKGATSARLTSDLIYTSAPGDRDLQGKLGNGRDAHVALPLAYIFSFPRVLILCDRVMQHRSRN